MALTLNNDLTKLKVGDYFWCKYTATANAVGTFSELATKTDAEATPVIPVASTATPTGYFKYIVVDDYNGKKKLIADRNIQNAISWDVLNTKGIASGSGLPMLFDGYDSKNMTFAIRLLTGGTVTADLDNEWNKYIVGSALGGAITAGGNNIWNWSGQQSWTSTTGASAGVRSVRGSDSVSQYNTAGSSTSSAFPTISGFRPLLEIESLFTILNKSFILSSDGYKKLAGVDVVVGRGVGSTNIALNKTPIAEFVNATYDKTYATDGLTSNSWLLPYAFDGGTSTRRQRSITIEFEKSYAVSKLEIANGLSLSSFDVDVSNDGINFTTVKANISIPLSAVNSTKSTVLLDYFGEYKYWSLANMKTSHSSTSNIGLFEMEMYPYVDVMGVKTTFKTVSPTLPTLTQFQTDGMDDLSIFDRKIQKVLESSKVMTSSVLGVGKVYKSSVDLKKYFDLRKIEVK